MRIVFLGKLIIANFDYSMSASTQKKRRHNVTSLQLVLCNRLIT